MTPLSGQISMAQVRAEIGRAGAVSLNDDDVRTLAGVPPGEIGLDDLYGKSGPGSASTLAATGVSAYDMGQANGAGSFTAYATPAIETTGGTDPKAYLWSITVQDDDGFILADATAQTCTVSHSIGKYGYQGGCSLSCQVSDAAGGYVLVEGVRAEFDYQYGVPK